MSSSSSETDGSVVGAGDHGRPEDRGDEEWEQQREDGGESRISDMLEEEIAAGHHTGNGNNGDEYGNTDEAGSDFGDVSPAHTPVRSGSPADSMLSNPDDTPSMQVRKPRRLFERPKLTMNTGLRYVFTRKQRLTVDGLSTNARQPHAILQTFRSQIFVSPCAAVWCLFTTSLVPGVLPRAFATGLT
jgi:hypothetical protein